MNLSYQILKICYKIVVLKTVWSWCRDTKQTSETEQRAQKHAGKEFKNMAEVA